MSEFIRTKYSASISSNALLYPPVNPWFMSKAIVFTCGNFSFIKSGEPSVEALSATMTSAPSQPFTDARSGGRNSSRNPFVFQLSMTTAVFMLMDHRRINGIRIRTRPLNQSSFRHRIRRIHPRGHGIRRMCGHTHREVPL